MTTTQTVTVAVPLILALVIFYAVKHGKQKVLGVLLGVAFGVSLAPTGIAGHMARAINTTIIQGITALSGLFT
ncbi:hypothetical protein SAMN04488074_121107 [Lentzea albidocapillata subsp. violacea]|uniref:Uncharacterized protein n=1 Tax=Lentzea albidocapillata subsp. violacea TaxID=128104 RepID=A0A1G9T881_9PSEU|nr:hypothetical protein [Lentzea albidocapillata]SDM43858.1 hypothetical protein SAMN04488074_121107 [Lentzea albidocapillata subsp. violacea]